MTRILYSYYNKRKKKYNNKTKTYNNRTCDSIKESNYAEELDWRIKLKEIKGWDAQITLGLYVNSILVCKYRIDFKIYHKDGSEEYVEVKGFATPLWLLKWKICEVILSDPDEKNYITEYKNDKVIEKGTDRKV